jgi:hypothetical protein
MGIGNRAGRDQRDVDGERFGPHIPAGQALLVVDAVPAALISPAAKHLDAFVGFNLVQIDGTVRFHDNVLLPYSFAMAMTATCTAPSEVRLISAIFFI